MRAHQSSMFWAWPPPSRRFEKISRKFWYDLSVARKPRDAPVLRMTGFPIRSSMMTSYFSELACQPVRVLPSKT